jgi:hypothetical protein
VSRRVWIATKRIPDFADPVEPQKYPGLYTEFVDVAEIERLRAENGRMKRIIPPTWMETQIETINELRADNARLRKLLGNIINAYDGHGMPLQNACDEARAALAGGRDDDGGAP